MSTTTLSMAAATVRRLADRLADPREGLGEPGALPRRAATRAVVFAAWAAHTLPDPADVRALASEISEAVGATAYYARSSERPFASAAEAAVEGCPGAEEVCCWGDVEAAPWSDLAEALEALAEALEALEDDEALEVTP